MRHIFVFAAVILLFVCQASSLRQSGVTCIHAVDLTTAADWTGTIPIGDVFEAESTGPSQANADCIMHGDDPHGYLWFKFQPPMIGSTVHLAFSDYYYGDYNVKDMEVFIFQGGDNLNCPKTCDGAVHYDNPTRISFEAETDKYIYMLYGVRAFGDGVPADVENAWVSVRFDSNHSLCWTMQSEHPLSNVNDYYEGAIGFGDFVGIYDAHTSGSNVGNLGSFFSVKMPMGAVKEVTLRLVNYSNVQSQCSLSLSVYHPDCCVDFLMAESLSDDSVTFAALPGVEYPVAVTGSCSSVFSSTDQDKNFAEYFVMLESANARDMSTCLSAPEMITGINYTISFDCSDSLPLNGTNFSLLGGKYSIGGYGTIMKHTGSQNMLVRVFKDPTYEVFVLDGNCTDFNNTVLYLDTTSVAMDYVAFADREYLIVASSSSCSLVSGILRVEDDTSTELKGLTRENPHSVWLINDMELEWLQIIVPENRHWWDEHCGGRAPSNGLWMKFPVSEPSYLSWKSWNTFGYTTISKMDPTTGVCLQELPSNPHGVYVESDLYVYYSMHCFDPSADRYLMFYDLKNETRKDCIESSVSLGNLTAAGELTDHITENSSMADELLCGVKPGSLGYWVDVYFEKNVELKLTFNSTFGSGSFPTPYILRNNEVWNCAKEDLSGMCLKMGGNDGSNFTVQLNGRESYKLLLASNSSIEFSMSWYTEVFEGDCASLAALYNTDDALTGSVAAAPLFKDDEICCEAYNGDLLEVESETICYKISAFSKWFNVSAQSSAEVAGRQYRFELMRNGTSPDMRMFVLEGTCESFKCMYYALPVPEHTKEIRTKFHSRMRVTPEADTEYKLLLTSDYPDSVFKLATTDLPDGSPMVALPYLMLAITVLLALY